MSEEYLSRFQKLLVDTHACHTVILYGSRSRGAETADSDYDLIGFSDSGKSYRVAEVIDGQYIDAFVYGSDALNGRDLEFLRIRDGRILVEKDAAGSDLLKRLQELFQKGPDPLSESDINLQKVWVEKMLGRIKRHDIEGNFRRVWLQHDLLEMYFSLRTRWYLGPKESFVWLAEHDGTTFDLFQKALAPESSLSDLELLARRVVAI